MSQQPDQTATALNELKAQVRRAVEGADRAHGAAYRIPGLLEAIEALPSMTLVRRLPQEAQQFIESQLKRLGITYAP